MVNKTRKTHDVEIKLLSPEGEIVMMSDELIVEKGEIGKSKFLVVLKTSQLTSPNILLTFGLYTDGKLIDKYQVTFISP